jgi:hypothetical protein
MLLLPARDTGDDSTTEEASQMPQFQAEGEAEIFEAADEIDIRGEIARYSFVTAEKSVDDDKIVIVSPVHPKDLADFEGLLFQIDVDEEEDVVILRQFQMFFWPWEDDAEFEDSNFTEWLAGFAADNRGRLGYGVLLEWDAGWWPERLTVDRWQGTRLSEGWFQANGRVHRP